MLFSFKCFLVNNVIVLLYSYKNHPPADNWCVHLHTNKSVSNEMKLFVVLLDRKKNTGFFQ